MNIANGKITNLTPAIRTIANISNGQSYTFALPTGWTADNCYVAQYGYFSGSSKIMNDKTNCSFSSGGAIVYNNTGSTVSLFVVFERFSV